MHKSDGSPSAEQPTLLASILITIFGFWTKIISYFAAICQQNETRLSAQSRQTERQMDRHTHTKRDVGSLHIYIEYNELWVRRVTIAVRNYRRTFIWPRCWYKQIRNYLSHTHIPYTHTMYLPVIWCSFYLWLVSLSLYLPGSFSTSLPPSFCGVSVLILCFIRILLLPFEWFVVEHREKLTNYVKVQRKIVESLWETTKYPVE